MMAAVFSMQGVGQLLCAIVALIVTAAFKSEFIGITDVSNCNIDCQTAADRSWRIIVGFGAVPACFALYYRITIPETPRYTFDVAHDVEKADADIKAYMASQPEGEVDPIEHARMLKVASPSLNVPKASWPDIFAYFGQWKNARVLLGTTASWFFLVRCADSLLLSLFLSPFSSPPLFCTIWSPSLFCLLLLLSAFTPISETPPFIEECTSTYTYMYMWYAHCRSIRPFLHAHIPA